MSAEIADKITQAIIRSLYASGGGDKTGIVDLDAGGFVAVGKPNRHEIYVRVTEFKGQEPEYYTITIKEGQGHDRRTKSARGEGSPLHAGDERAEEAEAEEEKARTKKVLKLRYGLKVDE